MLNHYSISSRTQDDLVGRWVELHQKEMQNSSSRSNIVHRRTKSASRSYQVQSEDFFPRQQPVESLSVSFAKLLVNQVNGTPTFTRDSVQTKQRKKSKKSPSKISIRNSKSLSQIDHVEEWLQHRSPYYAWWKNNKAPKVFSCCQPSLKHTVARQPHDWSQNNSQHHNYNGLSKSPRCVLWFVFTGNPSKRPSSVVMSSHTTCTRIHSIRIDQQPLGGATATVFSADLHIGEEFAIVSRRQPGFTFSLTFFIDGVRHARLSGCCEKARNVHIPTRVGGPIGAFVLQAIQGGKQCEVCRVAPFSHPELFAVYPKSHHAKSSLNVSQESTSFLRPTKNATALLSSEGLRQQLRKRQIIKVEPISPQILNANNDEHVTSSESYSIDGSQNAQDQEQPSSEALIPGSVSIEESHSIASPIHTPQSVVSLH